MSSFQNIKIIGFDLDQTLYPRSPEIDETIQSYIYVKIAEHKKCTLPEAKVLFTDLYQEGKGLGGRQTLTTLGIPNAHDIVQEALEKADIAHFLKPDKAIIETLSKLKEKYQSLDLITGSAKTVAETKLKELEIPLEMFAHQVTGDDGSKSEGSSYTLWMSFYPELSPENFLYIGDRPRSDCEIPCALGMQAILVNQGEKDDSIPCTQLRSLIELNELL